MELIPELGDGRGDEYFQMLRSASQADDIKPYITWVSVAVVLIAHHYHQYQLDIIPLIPNKVLRILLLFSLKTLW